MTAALRYLVVIEQGETSFGAYVPDLPGCVAVGETADEARALIREAIEQHLEELRAEGAQLPRPCSSAALVEISART